MSKKKADDKLTGREMSILQRAAFARAKEKDDRAENGITGRVDYMLDEMSKEK